MIRPSDPPQEAGVVPFPAQTPAGTLDHLSASSVKLYLGCPLKFYFKKILGLPEPCSPAFHLGKAVHAGVEAFHRRRWRGERSDPGAVAEAYRKAFRELEADDPPEYKDETARRNNLETGERVLQAYLESGHVPEAERPVGVEVRLEEDFPGLPAPLLGYVDLVRPGNVPVDFKTCAATPDVELEAFQHALQLTGYQLLIEAATGEPVEGLELVFLVKTKTPKVIVHRMAPADEGAKARFRAMASAMTDGVRHGRFHPQPGMQCAWCAYRRECAAWKGGAA